MSNAEKYLKPEVIRQIKRLDLRARFIVKGFLQGLHRSPYHGFSVEFSEHRKYTHGDDPKDLDWLAYAKTDRYYIKKYEAETNITGYVAIDLSASMNYRTPPGITVAPVESKAKAGFLDRAGLSASSQDVAQETLTKFEYGVCIAAALVYLMIQQQDPVGLVAFAEQIEHSLPAKSKRNQLPILLALLSQLQPSGEAKVSKSLDQIAALLRHRSLVMIFSDLLREDEDTLVASLRRLRHDGHDVILFHIFDAAEALFPFSGMVEFEEPETGERLTLDADSIRADYLAEKDRFCQYLTEECQKSRIDYVQLDTGMAFDRALLEYLLARKHRF